ncbi:hypothetical protein SCUCBS95973_005616 [Sporothrix curviconia]|uniref:Tim44-like domain-containing protein n=1 Tax=Sporothrix curviconia TaxID=1260050 RepID=A0ABP0C077_9PEZI
MAGVLRQPLLRSRASMPFSFLSSQSQAASMTVRQTIQKRQAHGKRARSNPGSMSPSLSMAQMKDERPSALINFRIPETFVPPNMGQYVSQPGTFAKMFWWGLKARFSDYFAELSVRLQSKPSLFKGAMFKPNRKAIGPMTKNMHYQMLEATAAGDLRTLRRLLTMTHYDEIAALVARRPRGQRCQWELLSYKGRPTIVSNKIVMIPGAMPTYIRQVVVTIRSRQRFTWSMDEAAATGGASGGGASGGGANRRRANASASASAQAAAATPAPPRVVEKDVKENIVMVATLNRSTWQTLDWRIFGFMTDTTPESWQLEHDLVASSSKDGVTRVGGVEHR